MNFDLSEDEELLKAVAERFVADRCDPEQRRAARATERGYSAENWKLLGELGLIGALFAEEDGGLGIGAVGLATVFEALGRGLVAEPLIENVAVAGGLFAMAATPELRQTWLDQIVSGRRRLGLAHREQSARHNIARVETRARKNGSGAILSGAKSLVPAGEGVDGFVVSARTSGDVGDASGVALFFVEAGAPGLGVRPWRLVDGSVAVSLELNDVIVPSPNCLGGGLPEIEAAFARGALCGSAEALGIMEKIFADSLEYLRTRKQFGVALGSFQALQHRMVAQYAVLEQARGLINLAVISQEPAAIHGARAFIADASVKLGEEMIQMHGGMGVTDELIVGHGLKRLMMLARWPEDASAALDRYAG